MSRADRIVLRRMWRSDQPARYNWATKQRAARSLGGMLRPRLSWPLWLLKKFAPEKYRELEERARRRDKYEDRATAARGEAEKREEFVEATQ